MSQPDVICLGEAMIELALPGPPPGPAGVSFAGDTFNTAIYLKRCAPGLNVAFATKMGRDRFSDAFLALMEEEGLDTRFVSRSETQLPGIYAISTDENGERSFSYWRDRSAARTMFEAPGFSPDDLTGRYLFFSAISVAILPAKDRAALLEWLPRFRTAGGQTIFDSNYRPTLWTDRVEARQVIAACWGQTDIGLPSVDDEMAIFEEQDESATLDRLRGYGMRSGALKRGVAGPLALNGGTAGPFAPAAKVVDSTAAGDSFNAAYLAVHIQDGDQDKALKAGHSLASQVIGARGAILPREVELQIG